MCAVCRQPGARPTYTAVFAAGCVAGAAQLTIAVPVDLVKVRLQAQQGEAGAGLTLYNHTNCVPAPQAGTGVRMTVCVLCTARRGCAAATRGSWPRPGGT